jgi:2-keto-3-deoxy-galactonokinase
MHAIAEMQRRGEDMMRGEERDSVGIAELLLYK